MQTFSSLFQCLFCNHSFAILRIWCFGSHDNTSSKLFCSSKCVDFFYFQYEKFWRHDNAYSLSHLYLFARLILGLSFLKDEVETVLIHEPCPGSYHLLSVPHVWRDSCIRSAQICHEPLTENLLHWSDSRWSKIHITDFTFILSSTNVLSGWCFNEATGSIFPGGFEILTANASSRPWLVPSSEQVIHHLLFTLVFDVSHVTSAMSHPCSFLSSFFQKC